MTNNLNVTRDQIPAINRLEETEAERDFFRSERAEDVPELSLDDQKQEIDVFFDELKDEDEHGKEHEVWFKKGRNISRRIRRTAEAWKRKIEQESTHREQIAKEIAANRRAENAKELAEDLKEINAKKQASVKKAVANLVLRLESAALPELDDETLDKKAAKAEAKTREREERLASTYDLDKATLDKATAKVEAKKKPETILSRQLRELKKQQESGENLSTKDALEIQENNLLEKLAVEKDPRGRVKLAGKLLNVRDNFKKLKEEALQAKDEKSKESTVPVPALVETLRARKADLLKNISTATDEEHRDIRAIGRELKAIEDAEAEGKKLEAELKAAKTHLVGEEGKVDKPALEAANRELTEAKNAFEKAREAQRKQQSRIESVEGKIRRIEQALTALSPSEYQKQLPLKQPELQALHARMLALEEPLESLAAKIKTAETVMTEKEWVRTNLLLTVTAAESRIESAQAALHAWASVQESEESPIAKASASESARNKREIEQQEQERTEAKKEATEEQETRDRREDAARERKINTFKLDYAFYLGQLAAAKEMTTFPDRRMASIGRQVMKALQAREKELQTRYASLGADIALNAIKPRRLPNAERKRWEEKYGAKEGPEVEALPTPEEEELNTLNAFKHLSTKNLTTRLSELHRMIAQADVPSDEDVRQADLIEAILLDRTDDQTTEASDDDLHKLVDIMKKEDRENNLLSILQKRTTKQLRDLQKFFQTKVQKDTSPKKDDLLRLTLIEQILDNRQISSRDVAEETDVADKTSDLDKRIERKEVTATNEEAFLEIKEQLSKSPRDPQAKKRLKRRHVVGPKKKTGTSERDLEARAEKIRQKFQQEQAKKLIPELEAALTRELEGRMKTREAEENPATLLAKAAELFKSPSETNTPDLRTQAATVPSHPASPTKEAAA